MGTEHQRMQAIWKGVAHRHPQANLDIGQLRPTLHFVGHYQEPPLTLDVSLHDGGKDVKIAFDPISAKWEITAMDSVDAVSWKDSTSSLFFSSSKQGARTDLDNEYGVSHREYVISKRREKGSTDPEAQVDKEFQDARERAERFADDDARDRARNRACMILSNHKKI